MKKTIVLLTVILASCTSNNDKEVLNEAYEVHKEARNWQKKVISQWQILDTLKTSNISFDSTIKSNKANYELWKHDLLEVPGYPHIHLEGDEHEHHSPMQNNLPAQQILDIQIEARRAIQLIANSNDSLLKRR